jgi:hypothetical protein
MGTSKVEPALTQASIKKHHTDDSAFKNLFILKATCLDLVRDFIKGLPLGAHVSRAQIAQAGRVSVGF